MEDEYEYECSRAELLGLPKPSREEFLKRKSQRVEETEEEVEKMPAEQLENLNERKEKLHRIGGGLEELNSLLQRTQKKLDRFRTICGSFSNTLKSAISTRKEEGKGRSNDSSSESDKRETETPQDPLNKEEGVPEGEKIRPLSSEHERAKQKAKSDVDKLDSIIRKAERAELSLSSQSKQMKKFLNQ